MTTTPQLKEELKAHFEQNMLDGGSVSDGRTMLSAKSFQEYLLNDVAALITAQVRAARLEELNMIEYRVQTMSEAAVFNYIDHRFKELSNLKQSKEGGKNG